MWMEQKIQRAEKSELSCGDGKKREGGRGGSGRVVWWRDSGVGSSRKKLKEKEIYKMLLGPYVHPFHVISLFGFTALVFIRIGKYVST